MFLGLKEDMSVKRTIKTVGFLTLLVTLGTLGAYADNCSKSISGSQGNANLSYSPEGPAVTFPRLTTYCNSAYSNPLQSGPYPPSTPDRPSFIAASGQSYLDTINWEVNPVDDTQNNVYASSPAFFNSGEGQGTGGNGP